MQNIVPLPEVAEKVVLTVEDRLRLRARSSWHRISDHRETRHPLSEVTELRYREGEYPGEFTVTARSGERKSLPFFEVVDEFKRHKTHRCLVCADWWSGLADVSISDGDPTFTQAARAGQNRRGNPSYDADGTGRE